MMAVELVIPSLTFGGAERQVALLASALQEEGHRVRVITFAEGGVFAEVLRGRGIPIRALPRGSGLGLGSLARLARLLRRSRPTIVHSFLWSANFRARVGCLVCPGARSIISLRGFDDELKSHHRIVEHLLDWRTDVVVANCRALGDEARRRRIGRRARHEIIYNGIEPSPAPRIVTEGPRQGLQVGFIGRLERKKNPLALVPAVAPLCREFPTLKIVVVGDGALREDLVAEIRRRGLADRFELAGYQKDVLPWYGRLGVIVNTSISEGCCNVILEAMRAGLPVVATAVGGNNETVVDGVTGFLVPPGQPEAMADALRRILGDPGLARRLGQGGRKLVAERFALDRMVAGYLDLYRRVAAEARG
jgi:glycosyltransferase involved in cell wall biosynthesis